MKITIITVCFNAANTIKKTLDSVASQTYAPIEHIVIDGSSKDGTLDILRSHKTHFYTLLSEPDNGVYDAMNKGLKMATGDVIGILNADDIFSNKDVLRDVAEAFANSDIEAIFGDVEYFSPLDPNRTIRKYRSNRFESRKLEFGIIPAHPSLYLRRSVYDRFGLFNPKYRIAGDFEFMVRIFKDPSISYRYLPKMMIRMQAGGISNNGLSSNFLINREIKMACKENSISTNGLKLILRYPRKLLEWVLK